MKKLLILFAFLFTYVLGYCQYPLTQPLGSDSTLVNSKGGLKLRPVLYGYADTTAANLQRISQYPFAQIATTDNRFWIRNATATKWLQYSTAGSAGFPVDSVTSQKVACLDYQKYWSGGVATVYDTIQLYDGVIKPGLITETSPQHFSVTSFVYRLGCVQFISPDTTLITQGFDTLPRFYSVVGNSVGQTVLLVGAESQNPTPPQPAPNQQLLFGLILETSTGDSIIIAPTIRYLSRLVRDTAEGPIVVLDTFFIGRQYGESTISPPSSPLAFIGLAADTITGASKKIAMYHYLTPTTGDTNPKFSEVIKSSLGIVSLTLNANGSLTTGNSIGFPFSGTGAIQTGGNPLKIQSTSTSSRMVVESVGAPLAASGTVLRASSGTGTGGANSGVLRLDGNANLPVIFGGTEQNVGFGTNTPSATAAMDIQNPFGVLFPRMTTAVRDVIGNWVATVSLGAGGSGYLSAPSVSIAGATGKSPRITATISGGVVTALILDYHGTGVPVSGSLTVNNTGTGGTGATGTFTRSTGNTIAQWQTIINTDSTTCPIETWNGSAWISACGSGSGGSFTLTDGNGTTAGATNVGLGGTLTSDVNIDDNVSGTHAFNVGNNTLVSAINLLASGNVILGSNAGSTTLSGSATSIEIANDIKMIGLLNGLTTDSVMTYNTSTGKVSFREFPTGGSGVSSVTGTANRITSTGGTTPVIDISASYVGQSSITTLGTIGTGTWNATAIGTTKGGTNVTSYTTGDILYASASNVLSKLPIGTTGQTLHVVGGIPAWRDTTASGGGSGDTTVFNPPQFSLHTNSPYDTLFQVGTPTSLAFYGTDSLLTGTTNAILDASGNAAFHGTLGVTGVGTFQGKVNFADALATPTKITSGIYGTEGGLYDNSGGDKEIATFNSGNNIFHYGHTAITVDIGANTTTLANSNGTILTTPQTTGIDLSSGSFNATGPGSFYIAVGDLTNAFTFPSFPSTNNTIDITIVVAKSQSVNISDGVNDIYDKAGNVVVAPLLGGTGDGGASFTYNNVNGHYHEK